MKLGNHPNTKEITMNNLNRIITLIFILAFQAIAQVPQTMNYQGILKDAAGKTVSDGTYSLTFKIYDVATDGTVLWTETLSSVSVANGLFSVTLGEATPFNLLFNKQYWLGTSVASGDELSPRMKLAGSPYAIRSAYADIAVPIGSVMAWLKSFTNTPTLPDGWVECNGQTLSDAESPYNGQTIPTLNGTSESSKYFLRGSTTSGGIGGTDSHNHQVSTSANNSSAGGGNGAQNGTYTTTSAGTIPPYYEVVWIMKIK